MQMIGIADPVADRGGVAQREAELLHPPEAASQIQSPPPKLPPNLIKL